MPRHGAPFLFPTSLGQAFFIDPTAFSVKLTHHARRAPTPAFTAFAGAASRRQAKCHFGVQARTMQMVPGLGSYAMRHAIF
jgi:hypothetical protein